MHTTLAFMTLCIMQKDDEPREQTHTHTHRPHSSIHPCGHVRVVAAGSHELLTTATLPDDKQREVWAWAVARVLMILWQHDTDIIKVGNPHTHTPTHAHTRVETLLPPVCVCVCSMLTA